jgi:diguanylate cyclase
MRNKTMDYYLSKLKDMGAECNVLYVEDEKGIRDEMSIFLNKFFTHVECAEDGAQGLEAYKSGIFDIVISDIAMPNMNGIEMSKAIKELNRDQIVIIVTAFTNDGYFKELVNIGISSFILKPAQNEQIIHTLYDAALRAKESKENSKYRNNLENIVKERTDELVRLYTTDELTGLANYQKLRNDLHNNQPASLLLFNIDNFEMINNAFGVSMGDLVLKETARLLRFFAKDEETLYRVHSDEYVLLLKGADKNMAYEKALEVRAFFSQNKISLGESQIEISFTIGIDEGSGSDLLKNAKIAIREIRALGKDRVQFYNADSRFLAQQKDMRYWIERSREAIKNDLFVPYFQPIFDNTLGKIVKYECLARMKGDVDIVSPISFIEPAKISGLLPGITRLMVDKSFAYFANKEGKFSINIGNYDIKEGYLIPFLMQKLDKYGIDPSRVTLEVLETISVQDAKESLVQLRELKNIGFSLAIDDFGTENSNFSRLLDMEVEYIKIDGSFIKHLDTDINSQKITASIVAFTRSIGAKVIAEFVHNEAVFEAVKSYGIEYSQGYFIGQPNSTLEILK